MNSFSPEQKQYLEGFFTGVLKRQAGGGPLAGGTTFADAEPEAGPKPKKKKILPEEKIKKEQHPFDALDTLYKNAQNDLPPEKPDIFRFKWNGLFWLAPVHEGYMCRLRIPGGFVTSAQVRELASIADDIASGFLQITTRNNFQVRIIQPKDTPELLRRLQDCGLHSRGSGGDNLRNFTCNPTTGFDPQELLDVKPLVQDLAHYIINQNEFYDLPRKFNISFDNGGLVGTLEDTNDIGLRAVLLGEVPEGHPLHGKAEPGVYFQVLLGGVTGHEEFAELSDILCPPEESVAVIAALSRCYIRNGNRTNRGKNRLVYLLKEWGFEKFLQESEAIYGQPFLRLNAEKDADLLVPRQKAPRAHSHLGAQPQKQPGMNYLGVHVPVGLLETDEARALADIADEYGNGELRLTVWQNLLIPNIPEEKIEAAKQAVTEAGLRYEASFIRGAVAACTGNKYCKYSSADTKSHAIEVVDFLDERIALDHPINIHVTGCPHSCAQHYIGDIGLLSCKVQQGEDTVEGYHVFVGGGFAENKRVGRQLFKSVAAGEELNHRILALMQAFQANRQGEETFLEFTTRLEMEQLVSLAEMQLSALAA